MKIKDYLDKVYYKLYDDRRRLLFVTQVRNNVKEFLEEELGEVVEKTQNNCLILGKYRMEVVRIDKNDGVDIDFDKMLNAHKYDFMFTDYTKDKDCIGYYYNKPYELSKHYDLTQ